MITRVKFIAMWNRLHNNVKMIVLYNGQRFIADNYDFAYPYLSIFYKGFNINGVLLSLIKEVI